MDNKDSLKKRYASKLASNLVKFALGFVTLGIVPRALGPEDYGSYGFLTNFFTRTTKFLRFGVPSAYYTKLSRRPEEKKLIGFYIYYIVILIFIVFACTFGFISVGLKEIIWPEQKSIFIYAAALFAVLQFIFQFFQTTNDSFGFTISFEIMFIIQSFLSTFLIVLLYFLKLITLGSLFLLQYVLLLFIILGGWKILHKHKIYFMKYTKFSKSEVAGYLKEFYHFSHPLFINGLVVYLVVIGDRWLLQYFYGSVEQGYFTLALKIGSIVFLFTSAMSTLLLREMSQSYKEKNKKELKRLFKRYIPLFYFIAAYFAVFISLNAEIITTIIGGDNYKNASTIIAVMSFYPVHQTYGHLGGAVFLATEQTRIIRNVGVSTGIIGFIFSFFLITPYGFGMGALGLAIKMVLIQFIAVNIQLWINTNFLDESFNKFFLHQLVVIGILLVITKLSQYFTSFFIKENIFFNFFFSGTLYSLIVLILILLYPKIILMSKGDLKFFINKIKKHD